MARSSLPSIFTKPLNSRLMPWSRRAIVDLPEPLRPTMPSI
jgi:hypothetical protein